MTLAVLPASASDPITITVGSAPVGVRVTPDGTRAYVANYISNSVSMIDTATEAVTATVPVGTSQNPFGVAVAPDGAHVYVTHNSAGSVSVIETATNTVAATIALGGEQGPRHVAITPDGAKAYVTNNQSGTVSVLELATNTVTATKFIGANPAGVAVTPDGTRAYVTLQGDNAVVVMNTTTDTVTDTITGLGQATGLALTPDGAKAYVSDFAGGNVRVIATATNTVTGTIATGGNPFEIAVAPDGSRAYVVDNGGSALKSIDTGTDTVAGTVAVGSAPSDVAVAPDGRAVYVTNTSDGTVTVLRTPAITSSATATRPALSPASIEVTATGAPTPAFTTAGLPAWLSLTDNGDGTATISGTPPSGSAGDHQFTITATNELNQVAQTFTLTVTEDAAGYADTVLAGEPRGYWRFGESSGTTLTDSSGHANHGVYEGGVALGLPGIVADDTAASLDGVNDLGRVPDSTTLDVGGSLTLEGWIKRPSSAKSHQLMAKGGGFQLTVMSQGSGNQVWLRKANVTTLARSAVGIPADGAYHHVVATIDGPGSTAHMYVDGVESTVIVSSPQSIADTTHPLVFGTTNSGAAQFDEFALYDQVLTPAEVAAHHVAGTGGAPT